MSIPDYKEGEKQKNFQKVWKLGPNNQKFSLETFFSSMNDCKLGQVFHHF